MDINIQIKNSNPLKRKGIMNSRGYTLIELVMYIIIASIVITIALSSMRSVSKTYTRDRRKSKMQTQGRNAVTIMAREIVNTGVKVFLNNNGGDGTFTIDNVPNTTTGEAGDPVDIGNDTNSSFYYTHANPADELEIFKATLGNDGQPQETARIRYYLNNNTLQRDIKIHNGAEWGAATTLEIAYNIEALQFQFSTDKSTWTNNITGIKSNIKAIRIFLLARSQHTTDMTIQKTYNLGNITLSKNDKYLRRIYDEKVEVINNGT